MSILDNALQALFAMAHKELVWENASPTSDFPAQKISLSLRNGGLVVVEFKRYINLSTYYIGTFIVDGTSQQFSEYYGKSSTGYSQQVMRTLTVTTTGITFSTGTMATANVVPGTDDGYFIPTKIYEIAG